MKSQGKSAAHTPGPWKALHDADGDYAIVDDSRVLAVTDSDTPEDAANARLIAASPTMLEALKAVQYHMVGLAAYLATRNTEVIIETLETTIAGLHKQERLVAAAIQLAKGENPNE